MTSLATISQWFDDGKNDGATHMIVKWDSFNGPEGDYPVYVYPGEDPREIAKSNSDTTVECYALFMDKDDQFNEHRAFHWDMPEVETTIHPSIEDELRERIAVEIEESRNSRSYFGHDTDGHIQWEADTVAREDAARIARGGAA
jgi:hypothetical protein